MQRAEQVFLFLVTSTFGGSYKDSANTTANCAVTNDGGETWTLVDANNPNGYRSCIAQAKGNGLLITVGRTGSEYSLDKGGSWKHLGSEGYYACDIANNVGWAVGRSGKMAKINLEVKK